MANRDAREALRGAEEETFDLVAQILTSEEWAELLRAPLERAAAKGNKGLAQKLVRAGAEIGTALHTAARGGHGDVVSDLLKNGASVYTEDADGCTPLHYAALNGKTETVQLLLLNGAEKDAMDDKETTPLYLAAFNGHVAAALSLLDAGADVNLLCGQFKQSAVHAAAKHGQLDTIGMAIERGADVNAVDRDQRTPLHFAARHDGEGAIVVLVAAGANIEARDCNGWTPLHGATYCTSPGPLLAFLRHGADVNVQDKEKETPLHIAATRAGASSAQIVDSLLRSGADETILNHEGETASDVVGRIVEEEDQVAEDVDHVRELLANAPADKAWRRRGYLVLCRAHPSMSRQIQNNNSTQASMARRTRSRAEMGMTEAIGCGGTVADSPVEACGDWTNVVARVVGLQEEGIFRTIVGYL